MTTLSINGIPAVSVRLLVPWTGVWIADVDVDLSIVPALPTGPVLLKIGERVLQGTVDPRLSGKHGAKATARVLGGAGGWDKTVRPLHLHNPAGVTSIAVITATAAEVQERAVVALPTVLGTDYVRAAGPASRVLSGLSWHVDFSGTTIVGPRVPIPMSPTVDILDWEPGEQLAEVGYSDILMPGTILLSPNMGPVTVRDVEQTFGPGGARAKAWCSASEPRGAGGELGQALSDLAREACGVAYLRSYRYRVVVQALDGRLTLQAVSRTAGLPDVLPVAFWPSTAGVVAELVPGTIVVVAFLEGNPSLPIVTHVEHGAVPLVVKVGALATSPAARAIETVTAFAAVVIALSEYPPTKPAGEALKTALAPVMALLPSKKLLVE